MAVRRATTTKPPRKKPGNNFNDKNRPREFSNLRSNFKFGSRDDYLEQEQDGSNRFAYFKGGTRNIRNVCTLTSEVCTPNTITLYLSPNNVSWDYNLKTSVINTYGGQVVQILGVSIDNLTIEGFFGSEGMWGFNTDSRGNFVNERFNNSDIKTWKDGKMASGLYQLSEWFKMYFYRITQAGNFNKEYMVFKYPHMGWEWNIRPLDFPRIRFANDELLPQWRITCDFIEDLQSNFTQEVTKSAKSALGRMRNNVGFSEFIEWSTPIYNTKKDRAKVASEIGAKYSELLGSDFSEKEIQTLITRGFSYPANELAPHIRNYKK
jgi:hypothetical protein